MLKIGSHVSMSGKEMLLSSAKEAASYGANTFMFYTGAPQNTRRKEISELNIDAAWDYMDENGIGDIIVHAPYIINLANTVKKETYELAVEFLAKEIERTAACRSRVLVLHPGAHVGAGAEAGIRQAIRGLNEVLSSDTPCYVALETMAGKGSEIGRSFEELAAIYDGVVHSEKLRVCFDTCHTNDAGYDLVQDLDGVLEQFDRVIGKIRSPFFISMTARIHAMRQRTGMRISAKARSALRLCTGSYIIRTLPTCRRYWRRRGSEIRMIRRNLTLRTARRSHG